jgi:RHS repeat-associated protein
VIDPLNRKTQYQYDARGRLIGVINPLNQKTSYGFDAANQQTLVTDANGRGTQSVYDELGRLIKVIAPDPDGAGVLTAPVTQYSYDKVGNLLPITDPLNRITSYTYDAQNRLITETDPLGKTTRYSYDALGNLLSVTDALNNRTSYQYNALNQRISITDALGKVTRFSYDGLGNLLSVTDPNGNSTTYSYDTLSRLLSETNALGKSRSYSYDAKGQIVSEVDRNGRQRRFVYDALGRQIREEWLSGSNQVIRTFSYRYDAASQLLGVKDPDATYTYSYDAAGQVKAVDNNGTPGVPRVIFNYAYDAVGNLLSVKDVINGTAKGTTSYSYDALDRVTQMTQSGSGVSNKRVNFAYDVASQLTGLSRYSDLTGTQLVATSVYGYDLKGRLVSLVHQRNATNLASYVLTYDAIDRLTKLTSPDGTTTYSYNNRNELTGANHSYQRDEKYSYDAAGNRTNTGYQTTTDNRLQTDGTFTYIYDDEGNLIRQTEIATGKVTELSWDYWNRLVGLVEKSASGVITLQVQYSYDAFNRRIAKVVDPDGVGAAPVTTERYVYEGDDIALVFDGSGNQVNRYLNAPGIDAVLAQESSAGTVWALSDHQGTVRDLVDNLGTKVNHISYDSFGNITNQTNPMAYFRFGYTGQEFDRETGNYYYWNRYYDPATGRFLSQDPLGFGAGDANLYRYVGNSAPNYVDPTGFCGTSLPKKNPDCKAGDKEVPLTRERLVELGKDRGLPYDPNQLGGGGTFTRELGLRFERAVLQSAGVQPDGREIFTMERGIANILDGRNPVWSTRPDGSQEGFGETIGPQGKVRYPIADYIEVKSGAGNITRKTDEFQPVGYIDVAQQSTMYRLGFIPRVTFYTLGGYRVDPKLGDEAARQRVALFHGITYESCSEPGKIRVGPTSPVNRQVYNNPTPLGTVLPSSVRGRPGGSFVPF